MRTAIAAVFLTLLVLPALADELAPSPPPATPDDPNTVICRIGPPPTGSLIGRSRVCHTRQQWKDIELINQNTFSGAHAHAAGGGGAAPR